MKKLLLSLTSFLGIVGTSFAQDSHFTQYFASPLYLNPAHTGLTEKDWRATANYRSQWHSITSNPYITGQVAVDMPLLRDKLPEGDALGVGLMVLYDQAGSGALKNTTAAISVAYHKAFGMEKNHRISLGLQGAFVQKSIQFDKLIFEDEIDFGRSDAYIPHSTGETFKNTDLNYPDFNAGLLYSGVINERTTLYAGASYYHLTKPEETFTGTNTVNAKINSRYSAYIGGSLTLNDKTVAYVSTMYQKQGPAWEYLIGGAVGFIMNPYHDEMTKNTTLYLGAWYRYGDAVAPYIGLEFNKVQLGFSYDVNLSGLNQATGGDGAFEVSLIYNGAITKNPTRKYNFACPKF